jgi:RNA polymerase sigma factor (sigma-70 family)
MAEELRGTALRHVHTLFNVGTVGGLTDGQLLEWYTTRAGEAAELAFATLVERHGPMVLRVCRELLRDEHAAHDAFQATFLVLMRRAGSLWTRDSLGPWLYQVAVRVAKNARSAAGRRQRHERKAAALAARFVSETGRDDCGPVLHEELDRLPEVHRAVIVLCALEGLTQEQAARQLGWPIGTVQSRLARGRARLRTRLIRRGVAPGVALAALAPSARAVAASVPPSLADSTVRGAVPIAAAMAPATIAGLYSARVIALTEGVLRSMILTKLKLAAFGLLSIGLLATGVGLRAGQEHANRPGGTRPPGPAQSDSSAIPARPSAAATPEEAPEEALKRRLVEIARRRLEAQQAFYRENRITIDRYLDASNELRLAEMDASKTRDDRIAASRAHRDRAREVEANERKEFEEGRSTVADVTEAEQYRLKAELHVQAAENPAGRSEIEVLQDRVNALERKLDLVLKGLEGLKHARD